MDGYMNDMRQAIGMNEIVDGSRQPSKKLVGVAEMEVASTNNALYPTFKTYEKAFKGMLNLLCQEYRVVAQSGRKANVVYREKWESTYRTFSISEQVANSQYDVEISVMPGEEEIGNFLNRIEAMYSASSMGSGPPLEPGVYMMLYNVAKSGNLQLAQLLLMQYDRKRKMEARQEAQMNARMNAEAQQQSVMVSEQMKQQTMELEAAIKQAEKETEGAIKLELERIRSEAKIQEKYITGQIDSGLVKTKEEMENLRQQSEQAHDQRMKRLESVLKREELRVEYDEKRKLESTKEEKSTVSQ